MVIKAAEKGGAVVVWWADLNQKEASNFLTPPFMQESTKISLSSTKTSSKIRWTILSLNKTYRPLQKFSQLPLLELRVFTFYLKSTNLTTQVDPSFLPAVVPLNLLPAHIEAMLAVMNTTELADRIRPAKKFRPVQDLNPWPLRYRCSALQNELTRQLEAGRYVVSK